MMNKAWMTACAFSLAVCGLAAPGVSGAEQGGGTAPAVSVAPAAPPSPAAAAQQEGKPRKSRFRVWFEHLKQGLSESAVQGQYQKARVTAVAAVRGTKQGAEDPDKPSWKGGAKTKKAVELKKERQEFGKAVDLILDGKAKEGVAALEAFEKAHPKSTLLPEVAEAKSKAKEMEVSEAAAEEENVAAPVSKSEESKKTP
ncbi:MAG: hypothetical protein HY927_12105 [Elusimicrobia bacterium]|nr:hypothetical protein [Elusimicrobiota bacterium]